MSRQADEKRDSAPFAVAGDIGGTRLRAALVDRNGKVRARAGCPTAPEQGFEDATRRFVDLLRKAMAGVSRDELAGAGVSTAGPIEPDTGYYRFPPNLPGWHNHTMMPALRDGLGLPVVIGHDATVAAIAEARWGAARGARHVLYVTVSTGIGGGILSDGRTVEGAHGMAGEVGHMLIDRTGPACNAGCRGCLEVLASGGGIASQARARLAAGERSILAARAGNDPERVTGRMVFEAAAAGDRMARQILDRALDALATGFATMLNIFDPEVMVVGGSVLDGLAPYWEGLIDEVSRRALMRFRAGAPIVKSPLGDDVSLLGAAAIAFG